MKADEFKTKLLELIKEYQEKSGVCVIEINLTYEQLAVGVPTIIAIKIEARL